jgi:hypothetical protein
MRGELRIVTKTLYRARLKTRVKAVLDSIDLFTFGNISPLCVMDNKKGWIPIHRYPAFVSTDSHSIGFSSFLS